MYMCPKKEKFQLMAIPADSFSSIIISVDFPQVTLLQRERCLHDVHHLEIRFTSPSTVPQLNSISIVSKKEGASLRKLSFFPEFILPFLFPSVSLPRRQTCCLPSLKLVRIGVMHDGKLLDARSLLG